MVSYTTILKKFEEKGEKTGWTYVDIPAHVILELKGSIKKSFRVKGFIDEYPIAWVSLLPMGEGDYIMAINQQMRKGIKKKEGATVVLQLEEDTNEKPLLEELVACLQDAPIAAEEFYKMPRSHQMYYSNWIESGKTPETRAKRIYLTIYGMENKLSFGETQKMLKNTI